MEQHGVLGDEYEYVEAEAWRLGKREAPFVKPAAKASYKECPQPERQGLETAQTFLGSSLMAGPWTAMQGVNKNKVGDGYAYPSGTSTALNSGLG